MARATLYCIIQQKDRWMLLQLPDWPPAVCCMWKTDNSISFRACECGLLQWGSPCMTSTARLRFLMYVQEVPFILVCEEPGLGSPQVDPPGAFSRKNKAETTYLLCLQQLDCGEQTGGVYRIWVMGHKENHLITAHCCNSTFLTAPKWCHFQFLLIWDVTSGPHHEQLPQRSQHRPH